MPRHKPAVSPRASLGRSVLVYFPMTFIAKFGSVLNRCTASIWASRKPRTADSLARSNSFRHDHRRQRIPEALRVVIDQYAEPRGAGMEHRRKTERAALDLPGLEPGHDLRQTAHLPNHHIPVRHEPVLTE